MLSIQEHRDTTFTVVRGQSNINNTLEAVGFENGDKFVVLLDPEVLYVKSTDNEDFIGKTGARTVTIKGARRAGNNSLEYLTEDLNLRGTARVTTKYAYTEIYDVEVREYGSSAANKGNITVERLGADYEDIFTIDNATGARNSSLYVSTANTKIKQLSVFINAVSEDIDFTSVFYEITVKKLPALPAGAFESLTLDPSSGDNPGVVIGKYICPGGRTVLEMFESLRPSDIVFCTAKNLSNTDTYSVLTEMVIYE